MAMHKVFKNLIYVATAEVGTKMIGFFTAFWVPKILQPSDYGLWVSLTLIVTYAGIAHFGTLTAIIKEGPYYLGRGDHKKLAEIESTALGSLILSSLLVLIGGLILEFSLPRDGSSGDTSLLWIMVFAAIVTLFSLYNRCRFTIRQDFQYVSALETLYSILNFLFLVGFSWLWGLKGTVSGLLTSEFILCVISYVLANRNYRGTGIRMDFRFMGTLIRIGFPIMVINLFFILLTSVDRVISIAMLGSTITGYYGLGGTIANLVVLIPYGISRVLFPKMSEKLGATLDHRALAPLIINPAQALSLALPLPILMLILGCPYVFHQLLPKYAPGLLAAQILLVGCFFLSLMRNGANLLIATNRNWLMLRHMIVSFILNAGGNVALVKLGYGIEGIAFSTAFSQMVLTTLIWQSILSMLDYSPARQVRMIASLYMPYLWIQGIQILLVLCFPALTQSDIQGPAIQLGALAIALGLLMIILPVYRAWFGELSLLVRTRLLKTHPSMPGAPDQGNE